MSLGKVFYWLPISNRFNIVKETLSLEITCAFLFRLAVSSPELSNALVSITWRSNWYQNELFFGGRIGKFYLCIERCFRTLLQNYLIFPIQLWDYKILFIYNGATIRFGLRLSISISLYYSQLQITSIVLQFQCI